MGVAKGTPATGVALAMNSGSLQSLSQGLRVLHVNAGNVFGGLETILVTLARLRDCCPSMESHFAMCYEGRLSRELIGLGARYTCSGMLASAVRGR